MEQLERELSRAGRAGLVLEKYRDLAGERALGFCAGIRHAEYMAGYFNEHGVKAAAVHSGPGGSGHTVDRKTAVDALAAGDLKVIFAVDIFNEGVDIPALDTVMFLRPTDSFTVFLQQLGRGLRKYPGKKHLIVLDFIGNYRRAHYIPALLAGENPATFEPRGRKPQELEYPEGCQVQFDFNVLELFKELAARDPLQKRMRDEYFRLKSELDHQPTRTELYHGTDLPMREFLREGWLRFLQPLGELTPEETAWLETPAEEFLLTVEKTPFTKAYKIPTLLSLLSQDGDLKARVGLAEIGASFVEFYHGNPLHAKDLEDKSSRGWRSWGAAEFAALARRNPVHFLCKNKFFKYDEINRVFWLDESLQGYLGRSLGDHLRDILEYRRIEFFRKRYRNG